MTFLKALATQTKGRDERGRRWIFVPYDQLTDAVGPLAREPAKELAILVVENPEKAARRPYHKQKLGTVIANVRHFALEQAARGVFVRHVVGGYAEAVSALKKPVRVMRPAERELRVELADIENLEEIPHEGWLTTPEDFAKLADPPWRMDAFYKLVRRRTKLLMTKAGKPVGGQFSFDPENRKPWHGSPEAPRPPSFRADAITNEACDLVEGHFGKHPGILDRRALAATAHDAERLWKWAKTECLPSFGPFEDAMSTESRGLFHTRISPLLNVLRILAPRIVAEVADDDAIPLASREGFVRQILGWREYMHHVHEATDGFRHDPRTSKRARTLRHAGDGGYATWAGKKWPGRGGDGGSLASHLGAANGVPPAYWGTKSGLNCLDTVVEAVWSEGWSHHITRLMVLSNIAMLLDVSPRELTDWFWVAYADAYDWVVEPNVHGMGTFGLGDLLTTKPYVAGSGYIHKMSNFCESCRFDPKKTCPLGPMYWAYLNRHEKALSEVQRMTLPLRASQKRTAAQRRADAAVFEEARAALAKGKELDPPKRQLKLL